MNPEIEAFRRAGEDAGLLVRTAGIRSLRTGLVFTTPDGAVVDLLQHTRFDAAGTWSEFSHREAGHEVRYGNAASTAAPGGVPRLDVGGAIPSYAAHRVLVRFAASAEDHVDFLQFAESPAPEVQRARFERQGAEDLVIDGIEVHAERIGLVIDGRPANTFWFRGASRVASDWGGARSSPVKDARAVIAGLDVRIRDRAVALLGAPGIS